MAKTTRKPKLTDAERHKRFVDMAREVGASEKLQDFDKAFSKVARRKADTLTKQEQEALRKDGKQLSKWAGKKFSNERSS